MANPFNYAANINFTAPVKKKTKKEDEQYQTPLNMSVNTTIGRIKPENPMEDSDVLGAAYDILNGEQAETLLNTYPNASKKLSALASFLKDSYLPEVKINELFDAYPELSENVKTKIYARIKPVVTKEKAKMELQQEPLDVKEKAAALGLGITQGASGVGQNLVGSPMTKAGERLGEKLKDTKFAKKVQEIAIKQFGEDAVRTFAREENMRKERGEGGEEGNIFTAIGQEKLGESGFSKAGETIGKESAILGLTAGAGGLAAGATRATIGGVGIRGLGSVGGKAVQLAKGAIAGGAAGVVGTEINTLGKEGRLATKKELKSGLTIGAIAGGVLANKITPTQKQIGKTILPKMTPSELSDRGMKGLIKTNMLGKVSPILSKQEQQMVKAAEKIISPSKSNVANLNKVLGVVKSEGNKLKDVLSKNKTFTWKTNDVLSRMDDVELPPMLKADKTMSRAYDLVKSQFKTILDKQPKTAAGLLAARQEFDDVVRNGFPNLYTSETLTPMKAAITSLRKIPNTVLDEGIGGSIVKNSLKKQSLLLDVADNLSTKLEAVGSTKVSRLYKKYGDLAKAVIYLGGGAYGGVKLTEFAAGQ